MCPRSRAMSQISRGSVALSCGRQESLRLARLSTGPRAAGCRNGETARWAGSVERAVARS